LQVAHSQQPSTPVDDGEHDDDDDNDDGDNDESNDENGEDKKKKRDTLIFPLQDKPTAISRPTADCTVHILKS
jgi:hypothetical protein